MLAIIPQALKWLSIRVWFLEFTWYTRISLCQIYRLSAYFFRLACDFDLSVIILHPHTSNCAIFWRGTWHIHFASASLSYLAVISPLSFLLNVCINSCYVCFFAPMPCATLMESAIHCTRTQLATHRHTNQHCCLIFFLSVWQFLAKLFHHLYVCLMFAHTEWFQNRNVAFIQIHVLWKVA